VLGKRFPTPRSSHMERGDLSPLLIQSCDKSQHSRMRLYIGLFLPAYTNRQPRASRSTTRASRCLLGLLVLFCLACAMAGCRRGGRPGVLVIAAESPPRGFDPRFSTSFQTSARIMQLIYDTLLVKNEKFEFAPSLAERFEESEDHKIFTFHLRAGVKFHNGKSLTASDVKYTFDSLLSPRLKSPIRGAVDKITSLEAPDPYTVIFRADEPFYSFIGNLPAIGIIPEGAGVEIINSPIGSGPYRFVSYNEGDAVQLQSNPDYWGGAPGI